MSISSYTPRSLGMTHAAIGVAFASGSSSMRPTDGTSDPGKIADDKVQLLRTDGKTHHDAGPLTAHVEVGRAFMASAALSCSRPSEDFVDSNICLATDRRLAGNVKLRRILSTYIGVFDMGIQAAPDSVSCRDLYHNLAAEFDGWRTEEEEGVDGKRKTATQNLAESSDPVMLTNIASYTLHAKVVVSFWTWSQD